jgi:heme/copper-type cytochrome/quinol oxidase subunit 4
MDGELAVHRHRHAAASAASMIYIVWALPIIFTVIACLLVAVRFGML